MKIVTSVTILTTAEGKRMSLTYSEVDGDGNIIKENQRVNRVVVNKNILDTIADLEDAAQRTVEGM